MLREVGVATDKTRKFRSAFELVRKLSTLAAETKSGRQHAMRARRLGRKARQYSTRATHCSKSSLFVQKINFSFFLGEKLVKML